MKHAIVTGAAGFIGSHLVDRLLSEGWRVTGIDNFDPFYPREIKERNISAHRKHPEYRLLELDIRHLDRMQQELTGKFDVIVHLAAKAGVRPSIEDPLAYQEVNVQGIQNMLELARVREIKQFVFASSSSVYGVNPNTPWEESDHVLMPISPYASTKVSGELLGHVYSHLYGIRFIGLRFFTVYGPRQRPDLAIHKFSESILSHREIEIYGNGSSTRDYTYIDDIVDGIILSLSYRSSKYEIINLGNQTVIPLLELVRMLEKYLGQNAKIRFLNNQPGDVPKTFSCSAKAEECLGWKSKTPLESGVILFSEWLKKLRQDKLE